ncbi:uncharacterized protein LOC132938124 [Metopolophium dirhodum]|uniref:uncharacterized protein LOC132938124 n=1 Tax=Metopolophium dirhodum TaxID=44670 RepID=UPI00299020B4|nr:uncharacterized protein LOC132938124 [Metopolophium dirhodum]
MNDRLCNKIDSLKDDVKRFTSQMVPTFDFSNDTEDVSFLSQFPLSSKESVVECEKVLQIDCNIKEKLKNMFCSIGGNDGKTHLRRILSKTFTNKFVIDCSWTGRAFEKDTNQFCNLTNFSEDIQPIEDLICATSSIKDKNKDLVQHLRKWAVQFNVSHACANEILKILRSTATRMAAAAEILSTTGIGVIYYYARNTDVSIVVCPAKTILVAATEAVEQTRPRRISRTKITESIRTSPRCDPPIPSIFRL